MAKVITSNGIKHLQGHSLSNTMCGKFVNPSAPLEDGDLTCPECAEVALRAIAGTTKKERKLWRSL